MQTLVSYIHMPKNGSHSPQDFRWDNDQSWRDGDDKYLHRFAERKDTGDPHPDFPPRAKRREPLKLQLAQLPRLALGPQKSSEAMSEKKGLGGTRDSEFSVGRGGFSNWENKHLICHRMSVPHRRFGKTAQLPHPVSLLASAHAAVRTACFTSRGVCAVSSNAEAGHTCSKDSREDLGLHRYLHQTQAVKGGFRLNRWKLDEVNRKKDLGGYLAATGSI